MDTNNKKELIKQVNSYNIFDNLKSDYFLGKVFNNLKKKKYLELIKYNNDIKKRMNLNINNYKEYCEKFSSIEIEIIPIKNEYGQFININEEEKIYYHIYFNDNKEEEIKRNFLNKNDKVTKINIIIDYQIISFMGLFDDCSNIESIYFKKFYRNNINDMRYMFDKCYSLKEINLSNFNTNNVTSMNRMFGKCSKELKKKIRAKYNNIKEEAYGDLF